MQSCEAWRKRRELERGLGEEKVPYCMKQVLTLRSVTCLKHSLSVFFCQTVDLELQWEKLLQILTTNSHTAQVF